ncbi:MAG: glutamine--tRNA ligase, partial [Chloroflexota bacterium]
RHALSVQIRMYDRLFSTPNPTKADFIQQLNPDSLKVVDKAVVEPSIAEAKPGERFQFERLGYFCVDPDSSSEDLILNRTIALRDTWAKISRKK